MRKKLIVGNWKMHGSKQSVNELLNKIKSTAVLNSSVDLVVCPPSIFLDQVETLLTGSSIAWGGQTMSEHRVGPYTGEVSGSMLMEFGCDYVLLGHSERRQCYGETNEQIAKKFQLANELGLRPILCLGETLAQRQSKQTHDVLKKQLEQVLNQGINTFQTAILAYEPVWAIGTGLTASPEQAAAVHGFLREQLAACDQALAQKIPILYGGSVKPANAKGLFNMPGIDGGLIGGASLHAQEFLTIYEDCVSSVN